MTSSPVIQVSGIRKAYGQVVAVDDVSFEVRRGEIFGLIGPNGAGKTTTMECVEGLRSPDRGSISVLALDPVRHARALQHRMGVQLQQAQLQKRITVWEAVDLWASLYPHPVDGKSLLERLGLLEKRNAWFMTLSGGQRQRLFIALALIHDPEVVLLDELTTGLDPQARRAIWEMVRGIRDRGKTVLLTTHLMEEAERLCDRVAIVERGRVIDSGTPDGLVRRHCPEQTVVLATSDAGAGDRFRAIAGVTAVAHQDGRYTSARGSRADPAAVSRGVAARRDLEGRGLARPRGRRGGPGGHLLRGDGRLVTALPLGVARFPLAPRLRRRRAVRARPRRDPGSRSGGHAATPPATCPSPQSRCGSRVGSPR